MDLMPARSVKKLVATRVLTVVSMISYAVAVVSFVVIFTPVSFPARMLLLIGAVVALVVAMVTSSFVARIADWPKPPGDSGGDEPQ